MNYKVIISGGGSGGHIFPAIAIANALKNNPNYFGKVDILFIGAKGRMEEKKVPEAGYKIKTLWISGFQRKLTFKNLLFPLKLIYSLLQARSILKQFKPDVVVGVGGFASGPVLKVATKMKIPTLIQEQNSFPGITNRILASKVDKICVAYEGMNKFFPENKIYFTGNPIRQDILDLREKRAKGIELFGLSNDKKTLLVIGGSLGARTINTSISQYLELFIENNIQVLWQTGKNYHDLAMCAINNHSSKCQKAYEFINKMDYAYAVADIIVSRAGAIAISELCAVKKPVILIPSPNVAEDHQTKNANTLVERRAAIMVKDSEAAKLLGKTVLDLLQNESLQRELSKNIGELAKTDSAERIAEEILKLVEKRV